jgi:alpha-glucosidase
MPWDGGPNAGFAPAGATPWLPLGDGPSVAAQSTDPRSLLALHRALLALRRTEPALWGGSHETVAAGDGVLAYRRGGTHLVVLNLTAEPREHPAAGRVALSTGLDRDSEAVARTLALRGGEGVVLRIAEP